MPGIPGPFTDPITGADYVEEETGALIRLQGKGLFSEDATSMHGALLSVFATCLAVVRDMTSRILVNACPATAIEALDKWEDVFRLPRAPDRWDTGRRQRRLLRHTTLERGASVSNLEAFFGSICEHPAGGPNGFSWICADANAVAAGLDVFDWIVVLTDDCFMGTGAWDRQNTDVIWQVLDGVGRVSPAHMHGMISYESLYPPPP